MKINFFLRLIFFKFTGHDYDYATTCTSNYDYAQSVIDYNRLRPAPGLCRSCVPTVVPTCAGRRVHVRHGKQPPRLGQHRLLHTPTPVTSTTSHQHTPGLSLDDTTGRARGDHTSSITITITVSTKLLVTISVA